MHVQKLVYIAHGWNLAVNNEPLIDEPFQAWDYGPVVPSLYRALRRYGADPVARLIRVGDVNDTYDESDVVARLEPAEVRVIDQIWNDFKGFEAFQLSALTHKERSPWHVTMHAKGKNQPIANNDIQGYFSQLADAP